MDSLAPGISFRLAMVGTSPSAAYHFAIRAPDRLVLLLLVGFAAVLQVRCAVVWPTGYDEMWHVFEASEAPFARFARELSRDPHPPLHVILLVPLVRLGDSILWPRLLSIVAAVAHIPLMFLLARRLGVARPVAWLCALLVCLSYCTITLGVRSATSGIIARPASTSLRSSR